MSSILQESLVDTYLVYKIITILTTKWEDQEAYKLGIIDEKGSVLKKSETLDSKKEKDAYTILIRFVFNLKRLLERIPGGKSKFGSYAAAAVLLLREEDGKEPLVEKPVLPANRLIPSSAPILKKLINGGYAQKIKSFSDKERQKFTIALSNLMDTLE